MSTMRNLKHFTCFRAFNRLKCQMNIQNCYLLTSRSYCDKGLVIKERVLSGIQPTGVPHLGNYVGAIKDWAAMQQAGDRLIISIVDLHSITLPQSPEQLNKNIKTMAACLLASDIDPEKSIIFQQSAVSEHSELGWVLGCLTTMPRLQHLPQWKEKSDNLKEVPLGIFTYPVLQAADILLYKATHVPVGDDQIKHIELARHLAKVFNKKYGNFFPQPKPVTGGQNRIKSLRSPTNKMSKSDPDPLSRIDIMDSPDTIQTKIQKAVTDCTSAISFEPHNRPGVSNLVAIHAALTDLEPEEIVQDPRVMFMDTLQYKRHVTEVIVESLRPVREAAARLDADHGYIVDVLRDGADRARSIAARNYRGVRQRLGMLLE